MESLVFNDPGQDVIIFLSGKFPYLWPEHAESESSLWTLIRVLGLRILVGIWRHSRSMANTWETIWRLVTIANWLLYISYLCGLILTKIGVVWINVEFRSISTFRLKCQIWVGYTYLIQFIHIRISLRASNVNWIIKSGEMIVYESNLNNLNIPHRERKRNLG